MFQEGVGAVEGNIWVEKEEEEEEEETFNGYKRRAKGGKEE